MNIFRPNRKGNNIVISAPSGVGKSTIVSNLISNAALKLKYSISATTRAPRQDEIHGTDYFFFSQKEFYNLIEQNAFLEYAEVYGNFYGTILTNVQYTLSEGTNLLFDIDWQGALNIKQKMPNDTISIFILPPSIEELEARLVSRNKDTEEVIKYRMTQAKYDISHCDKYDYIVVNDCLTTAIHEITQIILASNLRTNRISNINTFI